LAAQIFYHPVSGELRYQIDDSLHLSPERILQYKNTIESAINSNDDFHPAFRGAALVTEKDQYVPKSTITGHGSQTDDYSCGYRALHYLLQNTDIRAANPIADAYAKI